MSFSDYLENELLDHVFGASSFSAPATVYIALYTAAPNDAGGGTEVAGNNYSRLAVTNNLTNFPAASGGLKSNGTKFTFATPSGSWGTITHFAILDAAVAGNQLGWGTLTTPKSPGNGDTVEFDVGELDITLD